MANYNRLRIKSLKWISAVDRGAQGEISNVALIKRAPTGDEFEAVCKVVSTDAKLGIVFGWAVASTVDGGKSPHIDLQNDAVVGGDELIKIAADYVSAGAEADVMHDEGVGGEMGKVVFCLPLTADVKKALKLTGDVEGLAIGMKPTEATFARYVSGELNAFSIGGTGEREPVEDPAVVKSGAMCAGGHTMAADAKYCPDCGKAKKSAPAPSPVLGTDIILAALKSDAGQQAVRDALTRKQSVLTSEAAGHSHSIDLSDPASGWRDSYHTSNQATEGGGEKYGHSHAWTFDAATGAITIGADSGHSHTVADLIPADIRAAAALTEAAAKQRRAAESAALAATNAVVASAVAAAGTGISTPSDPAATVKSHKEPTAMATQDEFAALEKRAALAEKKATLNDAQRKHFEKLQQAGSVADADQFLSLAPSMRDNVLTELAKADAVVYESPITKRQFRRSDSLELIEIAQQADAATIEMRKAQDRERAATFAKRASETIPHFAKGIKGDVPARIMKALDAEFTVAAEHEEALKVLKGANYAAELLTKSNGVNPHQDAATDASPAAQLEQLVKRLQTEKSLTPAAAYDAVLSTSEGARLYAQIPVGRA